MSESKIGEVNRRSAKAIRVYKIKGLQVKGEG